MCTARLSCPFQAAAPWKMRLVEPSTAVMALRKRADIAGELNQAQIPAIRLHSRGSCWSRSRFGLAHTQVREKYAKCISVRPRPRSGWPLAPADLSATGRSFAACAVPRNGPRSAGGPGCVRHVWSTRRGCPPTRGGHRSFREDQHRCDPMHAWWYALEPLERALTEPIARPRS
jgi:hypothetical protein